MKNRRFTPLLIIALLGVAALVVFLFRIPEFAELEAARRAAPPPAQPLPATAEPVAATNEPVREAAPSAVEGELEGRVISSETREGIEGAELTWSSARGAHSARSGAGGVFNFRPPAAGAYQLASAKADGFLPFGPEWGKSPVAVTFRAGERVRGITVELTPAPQLKGRVVDSSGAPVPDATARVLVPRRDEIALFPMRDRFTTDAKGEFVFHAAPYSMVEAFHPEAGSGSEQLEPGMKELVIKLERHAADAGARVSLSGRVVLGGRPVAGALVHVASALSAFPRTFGSREGYRELTGDDGRFEVTELQPGTYDVSAHLLGTAPAHRFDVPAPSRDVELELGTGPRLHGRVTQENGASVPAFELTLEWRKAPLERLEIVEAGFVDPDGRYAIEGIAPGDYELEVRAVGFTPKSAAVSLKAGADTQLDVTLARGVRATGTVRTEGTRTPIAQARVALESRDNVTLTGADGTFVLEGVPSQGFSLQASAAGHNTQVLGVSQPAAPIEIELSPVAPDAGPKTELVGIGLVLRGRGDALVVGQVMPQGGAAAAGLQPGDEVVSVDGNKVAELGFEPAIRSIRGPAGTTVELSVRKQGAQPPVAVAVVRKKITN